MLQYYTLTIKEMLDSIFSYKCHSMAVHFLHKENPQLFDTLCKMFDLTISSKFNTIFGVTEHERLNDAFNLLKDNLINTIKNISKYIKLSKETKSNFNLQCSHITSAIKTITLKLVESIYNLYKNTGITLAKIEEIDNLNEVLISSFKYLSKASENPDCFEIFNQVSRKFLVDVLLVNLIIIPREKDLFVENEKEFCEYFHDLCYEQVLSVLTVRNPRPLRHTR